MAFTQDIKTTYKKIYSELGAAASEDIEEVVSVTFDVTSVSLDSSSKATANYATTISGITNNGYGILEFIFKGEKSLMEEAEAALAESLKSGAN